ncbi:MAG: choice-of-anchor J domain-containing protein [Chitinophagales bacterium]|nr:choice-of-anchor J domain-containing protein [Chitinophagales bacterium]
MKGISIFITENPNLMSFPAKKIYSSLFVAVLFLCGIAPLKAQIIFLEDFQDKNSFNDFTLVNQDGRTPDSGVAYVNDAWVRRADLEDNTDTIAVSTSWYNPVGASDDWMITPLIHIDSQSILSWRAKAQDADFPDGYQMRISTTDTARASFLSNFALFNTNGENPDWITRTVDLAAEGYTNQDVYFAFRNTSNDMFLLKVDDIMVRNPFTVDAKAVSIQVSQTGCQLGNAESVSITIENYGGAPLTNFDVTYISDDGNNPVTVTETVSATVAPGANYTYTFTQGADLSAIGAVYEFSAYVNATADGDLSNDTIDGVSTVINVESTDLATPYTSSYETVGEILGWSVEDENSDGVSWFPASGTANTGDIFFVYQYNEDATTPGDDWLFSTCLDYTAGTQYELKFYYKVGNAGGTVYPEKLKVAIGTSPDVASMTTVLENLGEVSNDFYEEHAILFDVSSSGTYYIGFHCYSDPDAFALSIDDVTVGEKLPPVAGFTTGKNELVVTFSSTSTDADSLYWVFGDGSNSSSNPVVHTYAAPGTYYVCITAINEAGQSAFCDSVMVDTTISSVALIHESEFSVFPNPTKGSLVIQLNEQVVGKSTVIVSDLIGKQLLELPVENSRITFDLSEKPEGVYFITLKVGDAELRRKILLAR